MIRCPVLKPKPIAHLLVIVAIRNAHLLITKHQVVRYVVYKLYIIKISNMVLLFQIICLEPAEFVPYIEAWKQPPKDGDFQHQILWVQGTVVYHPRCNRLPGALNCFRGLRWFFLEGVFCKISKYCKIAKKLNLVYKNSMNWDKCSALENLYEKKTRHVGHTRKQNEFCIWPKSIFLWDVGQKKTWLSGKPNPNPNSHWNLYLHPGKLARPYQRGHFRTTGSSSNHPFSGDMLVHDVDGKSDKQKSPKSGRPWWWFSSYWDPNP